MKTEKCRKQWSDRNLYHKYFFLHHYHECISKLSSYIYKNNISAYSLLLLSGTVLKICMLRGPHHDFTGVVFVKSIKLVNRLFIYLPIAINSISVLKLIFLNLQLIQNVNHLIKRNLKYTGPILFTLELKWKFALTLLECCLILKHSPKKINVYMHSTAYEKTVKYYERN